MGSIQGERAVVDNPPCETVELIRCPNVKLVLNTSKGRGVFATHAIAARTIIDVCPVLIFSPSENSQHVQKTLLGHYTFYWPPPSAGTGSRQATQALPLGLGAMFNHEPPKRQNVGYIRDTQAQTLTYIALKDIEAGEELCICYGAWGRAAGFDGPSDKGEASDKGEEGDIDGSGDPLGNISLAFDDADEG